MMINSELFWIHIINMTFCIIFSLLKSSFLMASLRTRISKTIKRSAGVLAKKASRVNTKQFKCVGANPLNILWLWLMVMATMVIWLSLWLYGYMVMGNGYYDFMVMGYGYCNNKTF